MRTFVSQPGCYCVRNSFRSIRWPPASLGHLAGLPRILALRCCRRITPDLWVGSFGRSRSCPLRISFITFNMPIVVLFNFILFYHLLRHNGCIDLLFLDVFTELFFVYFWLSSSLTVQRGLRVLRVAVPKYRHAGTGTIFCLLPTPQSRIYFSLLAIGPQPVETGIFQNKLPRDQKCFAKLTKVYRERIRTRTADRNFSTELCRTDCTSCHCKSFFLLRLHHRISCFVKPENEARGTASIKLFGGTFTKNDVTKFC